MGEPFGGPIFDSIQKACLATCIVVVPFTTAWAQELGIAILFLSAALLMTAGALRAIAGKQAAFGSFVPLLLAGCACLVVLLQLVPLPQNLLKIVSPSQQQIFEAWPDLNAALATPFEWNTISLTPHLTASGLALASAYFMLVGGLWFFLRSPEDVKWLLWLVAVATASMALVGLCQLLFGNGKFLWLFENPMRSAEWPAKGTFTNQNHFASFLALGVGCCLLQVLGTGSTESHSGVKRPATRSASGSSRPAFDGAGANANGLTSKEKIWGGLTILVLLAAVLTFSRGGIAAIILAMGISCFGFRSRLSLLSRFLVPAIAFCVLGLAAFGSEVLTSKWDRLVTSSSLSDVSVGRVALWHSIVKAAPSFAIAGAGVGSHAEIYPRWMVEDFGKRFSHAENGYLQVLLEMGIPGLLLVAAVLIVVVLNVWKGFSTADRSSQTCWLICLAGIFASLFHSMADFVWYIPACFLVTLTLLITLFRSTEFHLQSRRDRSESTMRRIVPWGTLTIVAGIVILGTPRVIADARSEGNWLEYRGIAITSNQNNAKGISEEQDISRMISALEGCLAADSSDSRALSDLAILYLRRFESRQSTSDNPMSIAEIRATVKSVNFDSRREMLQWMARAFGSDVSDLFRAAIAARTSVAGQPLRASPYLTLHQLAFLVTDDPEIEQRLMQQVLLVRPHSASVRYAAGITDLEAGRLDSAYEQLGFAFRKDRALRSLVLDQLLSLVTMPKLIAVLDTDSEGLLDVFQACNKLQDTDKTEWTAHFFREKFDDASHVKSFSYWNSASLVFNYLKDHGAEIACLQKALIYRPDIYAARQRLAFRLADFGAKERGISALKACLIRKPDDAAVKSRLHKLVNSDKRIAVEMTN